VNFRQFLDGSWTEVPSPSLSINDVPSTIHNELQWTKNKVFKPHGGQTYLSNLTLNFSSYDKMADHLNWDNVTVKISLDFFFSFLLVLI
jgi:hypothetical protein